MSGKYLDGRRPRRSLSSFSETPEKENGRMRLVRSLPFFG
jgi:hypothetical protein